MFDNLQINIPGGLDFDIPKMVKVKQNFEDHKINDVALAVENEIKKPEISQTIKAGASIAIGVGSRGVANIDIAVKSLVSSLKELGAKPFIFPAMGSHGGGTVENQTALLAGYGVTKEKIGAEIRATMDTVVPVVLDDGTKVHMDKFAYEADGVILINRVKPHTNFRGSIESGIVKMMTIGMGKINGASELHGSYPMSNFGTALPNAAKHLLKNINFLFGVGLVEDAYDHTAIVEAIPAAQLFDKEADLQSMAKKLMGKICFDQIDVLVVEEIGKEISGGGCDPNITGNKNEPGFEKPNVSKIVLLDLTDKTKGNATGFAAADVITKKLFDKIDFPTTYANVVASSKLEGGKIPIPMKDGDQAVRLALKTLNGIDPINARVVRIKNTLKLAEIYVSESMLKDVNRNSMLEAISAPAEMSFNSSQF
jgi:hypothetical protein